VFSTKEILNNDKTNIDNNLLKNNDKTNNDNNDSVNNKIHSTKHRMVEVLAHDLTIKLNAPQSYKLFISICYKNSEPIIQRCLGLTLEADNVHNKGGYFVSLIKIYGNLA